MDEFNKNQEFENNEYEEIIKEDEGFVVVDEEDVVIDEPVEPKKDTSKKKSLIAAAVVFCLIAGTAFAFNGGKLLNVENGNVITSTQHAKEAEATEKELLKQLAEKEGQTLTTVEIAAKAGPAVVGVVSTVQSINYWMQATTAEASGSGVITSADGYIVTNYHVVENATAVKVILNTGIEYDAKVIGYDEESDLAVLKINANDLTFATFGDSSTVLVGEKAVAIGNPLGTELMGTVTEGIISAVNRTVQVGKKTMTLIQTDAAINNGNSGGALLNSYGEVIGINTVKMSASGVEGLGFAIPSNQVKQVINDITQYGYVKGRLVIGVAGQNITERLAQYYELPEGFYVNEVYEGYGAYLAGIQPGDVIVKCDGKVTKTIDEINAVRDSHKLGETIQLTVVRNGETKTFNVKLMEERPTNNQ